MGFFDVYNRYFLNLLYDPRIEPGMTVEEVKGLLVHQHQTRKDRARWRQAVFSNSSRPISIRLISLVPAPIS